MNSQPMMDSQPAMAMNPEPTMAMDSQPMMDSQSAMAMNPEPTMAMDSQSTMMDSKSPVDQYRSLLSTNKFVFLLFFRGHWCPFCISYLTTISKLKPSIESAGGAVLIVTAQNASFLPETRQKTGYTGQAISDPKNELAAHLKSKGFLDVAITERKGYEYGMAQPAFLIMNKEGEVFEKWAIVPSHMNMGGATDRPQLEQVWENVKAKMDGKPKVHSSYKTISVLAAVYRKFFG